MFKLWLCTLGLSAAIGNAQWKEVEIGDHSYVSLKQFKAFYHFDSLNQEGKKTILTRDRKEHSGEVSIELKARSQKLHINNVLFHLSLPIITQDNDTQHYLSKLDLITLFDPVLRPSYIKNAHPFKTVILDPGHGGRDKGAAGLEAVETLKLAMAMREKLKNLGYVVVMTRELNVFVPLAERITIAKANPNALMISLHFNSGPRDVMGVETYVMSARIPNAYNKASLALATSVHSRLIHLPKHHARSKKLYMSDRGIRRAKFGLLKNTPCPTILLELGYLTNKEDAAKIMEPTYREHLANSIIAGIETYQRSIKKH